MKFRYAGLMSGVSLNIGNDKNPQYKDFIFINGQEYDLPQDNEYVKTLVSLGHLTETESKKSIKKESKNDD